jgi:RHS repeat-associated protein
MKTATDQLATQSVDTLFDDLYPSCTLTVKTDTGWNANLGLTSCWGGGQQFKNDQLIRAVRLKTASWSCPGGGGSTLSIEMLKNRDVVCPANMQTRTKPGGRVQCFRPGFSSCCTKGKAGNPIALVTGAKEQRETDYVSASPGGIRFERFYNSNAYFRIPDTVAHPRNATDYWSHTYSSRLLPIGTPDLLGAIKRPGGDIQFFDGAGAEIHNYSGAADRLQMLSGSAWKLTRANGDVESYDGDGHLVSITTRAGVNQSLTYIGDLLSNVTDSYGRQLQFAYDASGYLTGMTVPGGLTFGYANDSRGLLQAVLYPDLQARTYIYDDPARVWLLTGIVDENLSRYSTYAYDYLGRAISTSHAGADSFSVSYGSLSISGMSASATDAFGINHGGSFTNQNGVLKFTSGYVNQAAGSDVYTLHYDANGNVSDRRGFLLSDNQYLPQTTYAYDLARNLETSRTEGLKTAGFSSISTTATRTITTQWHPTLREPTEITVYSGATATGTPKRRTSFTHDSAGNVLTRTVTDTTVTPTVSRTWTYTYNPFGKVLTEDGPRTDVTDITTYTYYNCATGFECGQLETVTNALGQVVTYNSYNAHGQPTLMTDANGLATSIAYDARQRVIDRCVGGTLPGCAGGELTHLDYWPTGLLKKATNPDGSYIEYFYDAAHRLTEVKDGAFNRIVYTLDSKGNRTAENIYDPSSALRRTHTRVFNTFNQLWKDVNAAGSAAVTTTFSYDRNGNQSAANAPLSRNSTSLYDELNRLKQITDPASGITKFTYDANDNLASVTDPRNLITSYTYTGFGDLKTTLSPDTGLTTNTYDSGGNLDTSTDSRGAVTDYNYDAANRVSSVSFTLGGVTDQTINYGYDAGPNGLGRLTSAWDAGHSLAWAYDAHGRVTGKGQTVGSTTLAIGYGYNAAGQLGNVTLPSGNVVTFGYNTNGQVASLTLNGSTTLLSNLSYDPFGPITGWTWGNGTAASRGFDTDGKITQVDNANGASLKNYGYDDAFRITGITDAANSALSWSYGYDGLDRLTSATSASVTQGWTYDANGNRLTQTGSAPSTYTNSASSNRVSSISGSLPRTYGYDAAGNTLSYAGATFTYNNRGRMATASNAGTTATYTYDALGQRIRRATSSVTTLYVYDEAGHLVGEYSAAGALIQETVWLGDMPVATLRPNGSGGVDVFYVHTDHLNTPRLVTDIANNIRWRWDSDPFGTTVPNENPSGLGLFEYNLRFPGQQYDAVVGLHYNYFRDYDPAVGRYAESDPIGLNGGINTFAYAENRPADVIDPLGLKARVCCRKIPHLGSFRHCYIEFGPDGGSTIGLVGGMFSGQPLATGNIYFDNPFDDGGECGPWNTNCGVDECVQSAAAQYANPSKYRLSQGPNSNTFAGTIARTCNIQRPTGLKKLSTPGFWDAPARQKKGTQPTPPTRLQP